MSPERRRDSPWAVAAVVARSTERRTWRWPARWPRRRQPGTTDGRPRMGVTPGRTLHIHGLSFRGVSRSDLCVEGGGVARDLAASVSESSPGEEPDNPCPKWARPDLDWRPSGYQ